MALANARPAEGKTMDPPGPADLAGCDDRRERLDQVRRKRTGGEGQASIAGSDTPVIDFAERAAQNRARSRLPCTLAPSQGPNDRRRAMTDLAFAPLSALA